MKLKRLAAMFVAVAMSVTMLPALALADENEAAPEETAKVENTEPEKKEESKKEENSEAPSETEKAEPEEPAEKAEASEENAAPEETASAAAKDAKKAKKQPYKWSWDGTTLTISGDCSMPDYSKGAPWDDFRDSIKKVVIKKVLLRSARMLSLNARTLRKHLFLQP